MNKSVLKNNGLKSTNQRLKILKTLRNSTNKHLSAEDIYKLLKNNEEKVALATVYRVLTEFSIAGIVTKHNLGENYSVFELFKQEHHDHLVCITCGHIIEFLDPIIENRQLKIANKYHFNMEHHSLIIYGNCNNCR